MTARQNELLLLLLLQQQQPCNTASNRLEHSPHQNSDGRSPAPLLPPQRAAHNVVAQRKVGLDTQKILTCVVGRRIVALKRLVLRACSVGIEQVADVFGGGEGVGVGGEDGEKILGTGSGGLGRER